MSNPAPSTSTSTAPKTAFVLHSGGMDSTTCLYMAAADFGPENVTGISIHYGQRHSKELDCAQTICQGLGCRHHIVKGPEFPSSMLTNPDQPVPNISYDEIQGVSPTYVPFRNGTLISYITAIAMAQKASAVYFGAHAEDAANWAYPDCTPEFIGSMANAVYIGTYNQVRLVTPLEWLTKAQIVQIGTQLEVPWELTWSCYKGESLQCGICPTCRARREAFARVDIDDPTQYQFTPSLEHVQAEGKTADGTQEPEQVQT